ncbi:MAG TPA: 5'-3' exonuclease H3TH domain-containing protein [Fimbriimonas sp.]|nr:5'-3' exonuclease H3TH domain-containing protein [Fimbriimonas sp.]
MNPLLVVDGDNLAHRAYHSTPKTVRGTNDAPINAIVGFFSMLVGVWQKEQPRAVFVAWDTLGFDTYRSELWPPYQGGRVFEPEIRQQLGQLPALCMACGLGVGKSAGHEADDLIAAAALKEAAGGGTCVILTADRDTFQLASDCITILWPRKGISNIERIGPHQVVELFGVLPEQVPDFKALCGDPSDKIPGIRGIGPKAAASLLLRYGDLEGVLENWNRPQDAELALMFREVARMRHDVDVTLPDGPPRWSDGAPVLRELGANRLADRLAEL